MEHAHINVPPDLLPGIAICAEGEYLRVVPSAECPGGGVSCKRAVLVLSGEEVNAPDRFRDIGTSGTA